MSNTQEIWTAIFVALGNAGYELENLKPFSGSLGDVHIFVKNKKRTAIEISEVVE